MSFIEYDVDPDEDAQLSEAIGQDVSDALGKAVDLAAAVKMELANNIPDGLFGYIQKCRAVAVTDLAAMFEALEGADPTDAKALASIRLVQLSFAKYSSAVAFAQNAVVEYTGFGEAENLEGDDSEGSDVVVITGAQDGEG